MKKYKWKLYKTLEFLNSRRPDLEIRASFFHQLTQLEQKLVKTGQGAYSSSWDPALEQDLKLEQDEGLLRNTFQNSKQSPPAEYWLDRQLFQQCLKDRKDRKIQWADEARKGKLFSVLGGAAAGRSTTPQKRVKSQSSQQVKSILRGGTEEAKGEIGQQITANKIDNVNENIIIHLTVNNYLTPQQQAPQPGAPPKVNNFFENDAQKKMRDTAQGGVGTLNSNHLPSRGPRRQNEEELQKASDIKTPPQIPAPSQLQNNSAYRRQNDSLKKHLEEKKGPQYSSPYAYSINQTKIQPPMVKPQRLQQPFVGSGVKAVPVARSFLNEESYDRPSSANVPKPESAFNLSQKRPNTGNANQRQYSPIVKGSTIPKNTQLIVTNYNNKKQGMRYPSPGQQPKQEDLFANSMLLGKPGWK